MNRKHLTPTKISSFRYCPRLFVLNNEVPYGQTSSQMAIGSFEHEVFEKYLELTKIDWLSTRHVKNNSLNERISRIFEFASKLARQRYPQFMDKIQHDLVTLRYRLCELDKQKKVTLTTLLRKGYSFDDAINTILPWKIETSLYSKKYNILGRVDTIYRTNKGLIVEDIKSHQNRLDAFIHKIEHKTQLTVYAIMAEEKFGIPVKSGQIFYSRDLYTETFKITNKDKNKVLNANLEARNLRESGEKPEKLQGENSVRCECCYKKKICFGIRDLIENDVGELVLEEKI